jgi:hypothetical protein
LSPSVATASVETAEETPRSLLVKWANAESRWVRSIVAEVIDTKAELSPDRCGYHYDLFLREKELAAGEVPAVAPIGSGEDEADSTHPLVLHSMGNLERVNALASGQTIEFNSKLTVIFGENACGKTGYVRVLKKASAVKTARDILPNVFDAVATPRNPPSATLTYALGAQVHPPVEWRDQKGLPPFTRIDVSAGESHEAIQSAVSSLDRAYAAQTAVRDAVVIDWTGFIDQLNASAASAKLRLSEVQVLLQNVTAQAEERQRLLREREAAIIDLEARLLLRSTLPEIRTFVENAKWSDRANAQRNGISQVLRGLTTTTKAASEQLLNQSFERLFNDECRRLRAPAVKLAFPGKEGKVVRTKAVAPDYKPSQTLSEGEQKVIALADFLAEVELKKPAAPVVFDDPINSLDHIRLAEVVDRLAELAGTRQVIVFTHNIFFLNSLLSQFDSTPNDYTCYQVEVIDGTPGIVTRGAGPRRDSLRYLIAKVEQEIQTATGSTGEIRMSAIETGFSYLRNLCEVIAEKELLQGITERYRPNVLVSGLIKLNFAKLPLVAPRLDAVHTKCHRIIQAHSQPLATLGVRPTLEDLKADLAEVKAIRTEAKSE